MALHNILSEVGHLIQGIRKNRCVFSSEKFKAAVLVEIGLAVFG
jgi:hypothetical protein